MSIRSFVRSLSMGIWVFGLLSWGYMVGTIWLYPSTQYSGFSELFNFPQNLLAQIVFLVAFVAFVGWYYLRQ